MLVADLIDRYLHWQQHDKRNAPATVRSYRLGLAWLRREFGDRDWSELGRDEIKAALDRANTNPKTGRPWANDTVRRNVISFQQVQQFGLDQEFIDAPILRKKDLVKPPGGRRERIPEDAELEAILAAAKPYTNLAFRAFGESGMRPNELARARIQDIETRGNGRRTIVLAQHKTARKTGKPRRIVLGPKLAPIADEGIAGRSEGPIWPRNEKGEHWTPHQLSVEFRRIRDRLGLPKDLVLYSLRHYFATRAARVLEIHKVSQLLGHTNPQTTMRYNHPDDDDAFENQGLV